MKNIRKISIFALVLALALTLLTACGGGDSGEDADKTIRVAASPTPHAEILNSVADALAEEGWTLEVQEFDDYVQPNVATTEGDVDANYFQHVPYLDEYNAQNGTDLVAVANIHYEPMGVYPGKKSSFDDLKEGDIIAIPNDTTNEARALLLLEANGLIKLKEGAGVTATPADIVEYPKGEFELKELEAAIIPEARKDSDLAVINANYAIGAGLKSSEAIAIEEEDSLAADTYVNVLVVNAENKDSEKTQALIKALQTDAVRQFITDTFEGAVLPKF